MKIVNFILDNHATKIEHKTDRENIIDELEYHFSTNKLFKIKLEDRTVLINLQNVVFLLFVGVWLLGIAWALLVVIKAKGIKLENEAMKKLIRQQNDVLTVTLNRERKLKEQMKEKKHG